MTVHPPAAAGPSRPSSRRVPAAGGSGSSSRNSSSNRHRRRGMVRAGSAGFSAMRPAALLAVVLVGFCPAGCRSFHVATSPPVPGSAGFRAPALESGASFRALGPAAAAAGGTKAVCRLGARAGYGQDDGVLPECGGGARGWGVHRAARRRSCALQAKKIPLGEGAGDDLFRLKNVGASVPEEDRVDDHSDEAMRRLMFDMDPDSEEKGPMYFGDAGMYTDEVDHSKYPEEVRFPQCYLAFCIDRPETPDEPKNFVTWGVRKAAHWEHLKWARVAKRTFDDDQEREAGILWSRSVLSPFKHRIIGNMFCIRSYSKEGAMRLLEEDPYRKSGLFGTVSLYRYPYNMGGGFHWHLSNFPYVALCMDKKGKSKIRKEKQEAHLEYYERTKRCIGEGPIFDPDRAEDNPKTMPIGSLMFFNAINDEEARETAEGDPYNEAGLYDSVFVARFNEIDLSGIGLGRANRIDPMRDAMAKEGLDRECEYPVNFGKYDLFENMKWLKTEVEKKQQQQYMEHRLKLYQQRDRRIEKEQINEGALFRPGAYVYMGKRTETEWYDYWPSRVGPDADAAGEEFYTLKASYPPVDHFEDDLD